MKKNIMLIGKSLETIGNDIWKHNTNSFLISVDNINDGEFLTFVRSSKFPILCMFDEMYLNDTQVNDVLDFCDTYNFIPMCVTDDKTDLSHIAFLNLNNRYRDCLEYTMNEENEDYDEFTHICASYMKGDVEDDKPLSTSKRR